MNFQKWEDFSGSLGITSVKDMTIRHSTVLRHLEDTKTISAYQNYYSLRADSTVSAEERKGEEGSL